MSSAISFGGLISGLSTQTIVQALLSADRAPLTLLQNEQTVEKNKLQAWQDLNSQLQALQTTASTLSLQATVAAKSVTMSGPSGTFASGSATPDAVNGNFTLQIDQLATPTKAISTTGIGSAIVGADIVTSTTKTSSTINAGTFTVNGSTITITAGEDFNTLLADINTQTAGAVTASIVGNTIQLTSASNISVGSLGDTSNFLSVVKLAGQPAATTLTSSGPVGVANPTAVLDSSNINGLTSTTTGSVMVNGVSISYNTAVDSLSAVLARINASSAGVTASYDANSDTVTFTSAKTGNVDISLADGGGNLLSSLNVTAPAAHQLGLSAKYEVNGGPAQFSLTNTVANLQPGVYVTLMAPTPAGNPLTVSVSQNSSVGSGAIAAFVAAYNSVVDTIQKETAFDATNKQAGIFLGEPVIDNLQTQLDGLLFVANGKSMGLSAPFTDLSTIGISTGKVGSAPGTTTDLVFDSGKFQSALAANPTAVTNLVTKIFGAFNKTMLSITQPRGLIDGAVQAENSTIRDFQSQIDFQNDVLKQREDFYNQEFNALERQLAEIQSQASAGSSVLAALASQNAAAARNNQTTAGSNTNTSGA